jgi:HEAT repeat protein
MSKQRSASFEKLRAAIAEPITRETIDQYRDVYAIDSLDAEERAEIEALLIAQLEKNDGRAADVLADMGSARAIAPLQGRLDAAVPGLMRLAAARALRALGDDAGVAAVADVLRGGNQHERLSAVSALTMWAGAAAAVAADVETALLGALGDADSSVRSAATKRLLELHGLGELNQSYRDRLGLLQNRMSSPLASVREEAARELAEILARRKAGESPEQLGLTWQADESAEPLRSFAESLRSKAPPWDQAYALDGVEALPEVARRWVEDCLWHSLPSDPRAARALARLKVQRARAPLREALPLTGGEVAAAIATALDALGG